MSMRNRIVVLGALVAAIGAGIWIFWPAPRAIPTRGTVAAIDIARLNGATLIRAKSEAEVVDIARKLERSVIAAAARLPPDRALTDLQARDLAKLARVRVELFLNPDYERYREHVIALTGRDPQGADAAGIVTSPEAWKKRADGYRFAPIDPESADVRCDYHLGHDPVDTFAGHRTLISDSKKFYSSIGLSPKGSGRSVYTVTMPIEITSIKTTQPIRVFLTLWCVWLPDRHHWVPWAMGFNDAMDQSPMLPPWI